MGVAAVALVVSTQAIADVVSTGRIGGLPLLLGATAVYSVAAVALFLGRRRIIDNLDGERRRITAGLALCTAGSVLTLAGPVAGVVLAPPSRSFWLRDFGCCALLPLAIPIASAALSGYTLLAYGALFQTLGRPWQRGGSETPDPGSPNGIG